MNLVSRGAGLVMTCRGSWISSWNFFAGIWSHQKTWPRNVWMMVGRSEVTIMQKLGRNINVRRMTRSHTPYASSAWFEWISFTQTINCWQKALGICLPWLLCCDPFAKTNASILNRSISSFLGEQLLWGKQMFSELTKQIARQFNLVTSHQSPTSHWLELC